MSAMLDSYLNIYEENKIAPPFDMSPIANGEVSVLDATVREKILRYTRGSMRLASQRVVIHDVLILHNYGIRWLMTTNVAEPKSAKEDARIASWQSDHLELSSLLNRYCEEQARNALAIGAEGAAKLWIKAKGSLGLIHPHHLVGVPEDLAIESYKNNDDLYSRAVSAAVDAVSEQMQQMELEELKGVDIGMKIAAKRVLWMKQKGLEAEDPLVGKFLAWGAKSPSEIPDDLLVVRDGMVSKALFEKNLRVTAQDGGELLKILNENVKKDLEEHTYRLRKVAVECCSEFSLGDQTPLKVLENKIDAFIGEYDALERLHEHDRWAPLLAEALRLPRYRIVYFDWAACHEDEGPDEPGLQYQLGNGFTQEVHYAIRETEWWTDMDRIEWKVDGIIRRCKNAAIQVNLPVIVDQWIDIETRWDMCRTEELSYHCYGDLDGFANAFYGGIVKMSVLFSSVSGKSEGAELAINESDVARIATAVTVPLMRGIDNVGRNVLRVAKDVRIVKGNTEDIIHNQGEEIKMTDHDGREYKPRYEGIDLEMLEKAYALSADGGLTRASAASRVFKEYSDKGANFSFTKLENFRTVVYRYCEGMSR